MRKPDSPIVLVGNYPPDKQHSMLQYAAMLQTEFRQMGMDVHHTAPSVAFGRFNPGNKWLGYLDKLLLHPRKLKQTIQQQGGTCIVHVCDHSNSPILKAARHQRTLLTCHDLIAVRSALGEFPGELPRLSGRLLQSTIRKSIPLADHIACVSAATQQDLHAVIPTTSGRTSVVHNGFNAPYQRQPASIVEEQLAGLGIPDQSPILLHVGSNAWYKNRLGVLKILQAYKELSGNQEAHLVLAGPELDPEQAAFVQKQALAHQVTCTGPLEHAQLEALYCKASVLIFPSRHEGFGWPPVEAQSCGCPVVASRNGSLAEVVGQSAPTAEWDDTNSHAQALLRILNEPTYRQDLVEKGYRNATRFSARKMAEAFIDIYCELEATAA